jgi:large subunit ribosomal protein L21
MQQDTHASAYSFARAIIPALGGFMYAVIRTGGKQYRVSPGDVVKIEKTPAGDQATIEFEDVLAVTGEDHPIAKPGSAKVIGKVLGEGRGDKVLVFHFKRKKQYKKLQGHRQAFTEVRIESIEVDGKSFSTAQ